MAKLNRIFQKQFGVNAGASDVGIFGSLAASNPQYSKDPETIQSLNAFLTGWAAETIANNRPALEDFNALDFLAFYQLCYLFQAGIPEYDADTTYYEGSICQVAGVLYRSLDDDNIDNDPTTEADKWEEVVSEFVPTADNALAGSIVQTVNYKTGATASGSTAIPGDDTIPQNSEGDQYLSLAITPNSASNKLRIDVVIVLGNQAGANYMTVALFQDSTAGALAAVTGTLSAIGSAPGIFTLTHYMTAGTTSSTTFKIRAGIQLGSNTTYLNGMAGRWMGGVMASSITITEIKA